MNDIPLGFSSPPIEDNSGRAMLAYPKPSDEAEFWARFAAAQAEFEQPKFDQRANAGSFSYKYASLSEIRRCTVPFLAKRGIATIQRLDLANKALITAFHFGTYAYRTDFPVVSGGDDRMSAMQATAAPVTYAKRYGLAAATCVAADEDTDDSENAPGDRQVVPARAAPKVAPQRPQPVPSKASQAAAERPAPTMAQPPMKPAPEPEPPVSLAHEANEPTPAELAAKAARAIADSVQKAGLPLQVGTANLDKITDDQRARMTEAAKARGINPPVVQGVSKELYGKPLQALTRGQFEVMVEVITHSVEPEWINRIAFNQWGANLAQVTEPERHIEMAERIRQEYAS